MFIKEYLRVIELIEKKVIIFFKKPLFGRIKL